VCVLVRVRNVRPVCVRVFVLYPPKKILNMCPDKLQYDGAKTSKESAYTAYLDSESAFRTAEVSITVAVISPD
jgi:hypothetical protein